MNFQTLIMQGPTAWNMDPGSGTFTTALLQSGTLTLTGTLGTSPPVSVSSGAALDMAGETFGNVNNPPGTIFTHGAGPGTTLGSPSPNYVGAGGNIVFNTFLGADNSPSDRLLINGGTATGTATTLTIHNTTGPGEPTIANGIPVVNAINGATTAAGAFTLAPGELRAGIFDYRLFQGGITGSDPNSWFLRSTFLVPPATPSAVPPAYLPAFGPTPSNVLPPDPPPATPPPGLYPIVGPEIATYGVVQPIARQMGLQILGTLHERIGDTLTLANTGGDGADLGVRIGRASLGVDVWRGSVLPGHRDAAGIYIAFCQQQHRRGRLGHQRRRYRLCTGPHGSTLIGLNAYSGGGYWTHYGPSGWYLDAVVQGTYYNNGNAMTQFASLPRVN